MRDSNSFGVSSMRFGPRVEGLEDILVGHESRVDHVEVEHRPDRTISAGLFDIDALQALSGTRLDRRELG